MFVRASQLRKYDLFYDWFQKYFVGCEAGALPGCCILVDRVVSGIEPSLGRAFNAVQRTLVVDAFRYGYPYNSSPSLEIITYCYTSNSMFTSCAFQLR